MSPWKSRAAVVVALLIVPCRGWPDTGSRDFAEVDYAGVPASEIRRQANDRDAIIATIRRAVDNFAKIPGESGRTLTPAGTVCDGVSVEAGSMTVFLTVPEEIDLFNTAPDLMENTNAALRRQFEEPLELNAIRVLARQRSAEEYRTFDAWLIPPPSLTQEERDWCEPGVGSDPSGEAEKPAETSPELNNVTGQGSLGNSGQPQGALSGRTVYIYGGHGYTWDQDLSTPRWRFQRGVALNINEDQGNLDQQNFLAYYLFNAGATVVTFRPVDYQRNAVTLDNINPAVSFAGAWSDSTSTIFYGSGSPPYRFASSGAAETATATYTPNIPQEGFYPVYTWVRYGSDRINQLYRIRHTGGEAQVRVNHRRVGMGWVWLGTYHFVAGSNPATGSVVISNLEQPAGDPGAVIIADAIRFGNGIGEAYGTDDLGQTRPLSGYLRETESTRYWIQTMIGQPGSLSTYNGSGDDESDSWRAPPSMAGRMRREDGQGTTGDVYLGIHSNAFNGSARGTSGLTTSDPTANQAAYAALVKNEVQSDCQAEDTPGNWPYTWASRSSSGAGGYGEITDSYFGGSMDATIIEVAFHDNAQDSVLLREPRVRNVVARACCQAMVRYFNQFSGGVLAFLPEPPVRVRAINNGIGGVTLSWQPGPAGGAGGDAATGYVVCRSINGYGFGNSVTTAATSTTINGLTAGQTHFFRVSATNAGGESMPSEVLAVRVMANGTSPVLIVNGYDRHDRFNNVLEDVPPMAADRLHQRRNNSYDYVIPHGTAVAAADRFFDSCTNEAVISGDVSLASYHTVIWILGEESSDDDTFSPTEQVAVTNFIAGGGHLFASGAEIGYELEGQGAGASFFQSQLRGDYVADDAGTYGAVGEPGTIFGSLGALSFDSRSTSYDPDFPDTLQGINGSVICLRYGGGGNPGAAVQSPSGLTGGRTVLFGFPFECITSAAARDAVMQATLDFFNAPSGDPLTPELSGFVVH